MKRFNIDEDKKLTQGTIFKELTLLNPENGLILKRNLEFSIVVSQACDIEQSSASNGFLPNIILLPMHILEKFSQGMHLKECGYEVSLDNISPKLIERYKKKEHARYHYVPITPPFEYEFIIDFKHYHCISKDILINEYKEKYFATMEAPYRDEVSQRFSSYFSRIGVPD